ncbi:nucleoporin NUP42 [Lampris incognitus]|uniref:nucleoporin NUP42 n=1 Tax=Lampris incognitus TaxID=2546036 RepID=UPI0024B544AD|nr:nucleoporin NUP42 [Lampris incognitus]
MVVCNYFLQGRCRYGEKCRNEHPRGGGGYNSYSRSPPQQASRGGGGFGNRVWVNPSQKSGGNFIKPSSFSSGDDDWGRGGGTADWGRGGGGGTADWGRGGGGRRENTRSSDFSFSSQNRFSSLSNAGTFDKGGRGGHEVDENEKHLETIQMDMEIWESSGLWCFSCYSVHKSVLSGFIELSPEELRLEYCNARASGDLQNYANGINQLLNQWRSRVQELKAMNATTRVALLAELNNPAPQASFSSFGSSTVTGFGSSTSSFGFAGLGTSAPAQASSFSFTTPSSGFGSTATPAASTGFGGALAAPTQPPSGFGSSSSSVPSTSQFSFAPPADSKTPAFGSASGFTFSSTANAGFAFGNSQGSGAAITGGSGSAVGQTGGGFEVTGAGTGIAVEAGSAGGAKDSLFTPKSNLTPEELNQFASKRFTLGQIPLKPPPADMLVV